MTLSQLMVLVSNVSHVQHMQQLEDCIYSCNLYEGQLSCCMETALKLAARCRNEKSAL